MFINAKRALLAAAVSTALLFTPHASAAQPESATGGGQTYFHGEHENWRLEFSAINTKKGPKGQFNMRNGDTYIRGDITCLRTEGDYASMTGIVTATNYWWQHAAVGEDLTFGVQDLGEGSGHDLASNIWAWVSGSAPNICSWYSPPLDHTTGQGNYQVRNGG